MNRVTFHRTFSAAHRLWSDASKCSNIHGHNYRVSVSIEGPLGNDNKMVVPFDWIKAIIDQYDHALLLDKSDPLAHELGAITTVRLIDALPTTEVMAQIIANEIAEQLSVDIQRREVQVTLAETDNIVAFGRAATKTART